MSQGFCFHPIEVLQIFILSSAKERHTGLECYAGEQMMTEFPFLESL